MNAAHALATSWAGATAEDSSAHEAWRTGDMPVPAPMSERSIDPRGPRKVGVHFAGGSPTSPGIIDSTSPGIASRFSTIAGLPLHACDEPRAPAGADPMLFARMRQFTVPLLLTGISLALLVLAWHLATHYRFEFFVRFTNIPAPYEVFAKSLEVNQSSRFVTNIAVSLQRIFIGFGFAVMLAVPLGLLIARYRAIKALLLPAVEVFRPIPAIAWVPMSIMLWPSNEVSICFITFLGSFFPILLNTIHGVLSIDRVLLRAGRSLGARELALLKYVILPGALPQIFTGLSVGMGVAWVSLIAAEMISGQYGVGYFTWEAYSLVQYAEIALGMITIGFLGLASSGLIRLAGRVAMPWLAFSTPESNN
jgi:NitT/TauT family transport system permease protein